MRIPTPPSSRFSNRSPAALVDQSENWRSSVHVLFNSTCTDGRHFVVFFVRAPLGRNNMVNCRVFFAEPPFDVPIRVVYRCGMARRRGGNESKAPAPQGGVGGHHPARCRESPAPAPHGGVGDHLPARDGKSKAPAPQGGVGDHLLTRDGESPAPAPQGGVGDHLVARDRKSPAPPHLRGGWGTISQRGIAN